MAIVYTTTAEAARLHGVKMCAHGRGGVGKTTMIKTLPKPVIISAESGILSLAGVTIPTLVISGIDDMEEAYNFVAFSEHAKGFASVALDSISELAEVCLGKEKANTKDGRRAYGEMADKMGILIRKWRDLPGWHVYFSAKQGRMEDEVTGVSRYGPEMPGKKLTNAMPYFFDELFSMEIGRTAEGEEFRFLRTQTDLQYEAKDRSGALNQFEEPHLGKIIEKILAAVPSS